MFTPTEFINKLKCPELELIKSDLTDFAADYPQYFDKEGNLCLSIMIKISKDGTFQDELSIGSVSTNYLCHTSFADGKSLITKSTNGVLSTEVEYPTVNIPVVVMNYSNSTVIKYIAEVPRNFSDSDIEKWLADNAGYNKSSCYYMFNYDDIQFIDKTE